MQKPGNYIPGGILEACGDWYEDLLEIISQVQKDAYNEAISEVYERLKDLKYEDACYSIRNFEM